MAETFAHFLGAIQALKNRKEKDDLLRQALVLLEGAPDQNIEKLIRSAELHISFHHYRVPALHDRILNFVRVDGLLVVDSGPEIFALQHFLQRRPTVDANDILERHRSKPVPVTNGLRARGIKDLERLLAVGSGIRQQFLVCQLWSPGGASTPVPDHSRTVT